MDEQEADVDPNTQTRISRNPFACQYCYCPSSGSIDHLVFDSADALSQHFFDVHDPNLPYTCPYCPQKYSSVKQRDYHVRLIHPTAAKAEHCNYCKKTLRSPKELHEFNCQYVSNWHCDTCDQRFMQVPLGRFRTHQRHHAACKFKCRDCARVFVRRANLEAHERMHRPSANHTIQCEQCKEGECMQIAKLNAHTRTYTHIQTANYLYFPIIGSIFQWLRAAPPQVSSA